MTSMRRSSTRDKLRMSRSASRVLVVTRTLPSLQIRAAALSRVPPLARQSPDWAHAAWWSLGGAETGRCKRKRWRKRILHGISVRPLWGGEGCVRWVGADPLCQFCPGEECSAMLLERLCSACCCDVAARMLDIVSEGCWRPSNTSAACWGELGLEHWYDDSAHDDHKAGLARVVSQERPSAPWDSGTCAMAKVGLAAHRLRKGGGDRSLPRNRGCWRILPWCAVGTCAGDCHTSG